MREMFTELVNFQTFAFWPSLDFWTKVSCIAGLLGVFLLSGPGFGGSGNLRGESTQPPRNPTTPPIMAAFRRYSGSA
jgi:hypothetical protein